MERNDLDAIELSAQDAAPRAVGMPYRTVLNWLDTGVVDGRQESELAALHHGGRAAHVFGYARACGRAGHCRP